LENTSPTPIAATIAVEMIGDLMRSQCRSWRASVSTSPEALGACIQLAPIRLNDTRRAGRQDIGAHGQNARQLETQEMQTLPDCNTPLQQGTDLLDDAGTLTERPFGALLQKAFRQSQGRSGVARRSTLQV
jgi:hypothetical protein